jgi:hypothetical protein
MNKKIIVTLTVLLIVILFLAAANRGRSPKHSATSQKQTGTPKPAASEPQKSAAGSPIVRASYRPLTFALLSGGFTSIDEFQQRVAIDPVLLSFYGNCNDSQASMQPLPDDILVFITFRRGQEIKWTRRPILVHKGEYVLTLCGRTVLARCGNFISWVPMQPSEDVPPSLLEMPADELRPEDPAPTAQADPAKTSIRGLAALPAAASTSRRFYPLIPPIYVPSGSSGHGPVLSGAASGPAPAPAGGLESDEFSGHQALYTLLLGFLAIALLKLVTR